MKHPNRITGLAPSECSQALLAQPRTFMADVIGPNEALHEKQLHEVPGESFRVPRLMSALKAKARAEGLWNLFLPHSDSGAGLTNLDYAPLAEATGHVYWASEVFHCSAPATGNMELLERYGSEEQKQKYLAPLQQGHIRSLYCITEPDVASSDATNVETRIVRDGDLTIQPFGAAGLTDDFGLVHIYARLRTLRLGDGPDEVHNRVIARLELAKYRENNHPATKAAA